MCGQIPNSRLLPKNPSNGQIAVWNSVTNRWESESKQNLSGFLKTGNPIGNVLQPVLDFAGSVSVIEISTIELGISKTGTATSKETQRGSYPLLIKGSSWNGAAQIDAIWKVQQTPDLTQNDYPRLVGDYNGEQFLRIDKSTFAITYNSIGNTALGYQAGKALASAGVGAYHNVFIGGHSGMSVTLGYQNTFVGNRSGKSTTTGYQNTFVGQGAGYENIVGYGCVGVGFHAGLNMLGESNTTIGKAAGQAIAGSTATNSVLIGKDCGYSITSGNDNSLVGANAGYSISSGGFNSALGGGAIFSNSTGSDNVAIGYRAGYTDTPAYALISGSRNIFIGRESGFGSATQRVNAIAIGYRTKVDADNTVVLGNTSIVQTILRGNISIGSDTIHSSAILEITSTSKGFLIPRMTTAERDGISTPAVSLMVYNTETSALEIFGGTTWGSLITNQLNVDIHFSEAKGLLWSSVADDPTGPKDLGLKRLSPGMLQITDGSTGCGAIKACHLLTSDLSSGAYITAKSIKFGNSATITDGSLTALGFDKQIAIEHDGNLLYMVASSTDLV